MNNKLKPNILLNISKNLMKGLFPYIFSNYTPPNIKITNRNVDTSVSKFKKLDEDKCSKTKKKLMYSISSTYLHDSLWHLDYKNNNGDMYKYRVSFNKRKNNTSNIINKNLINIKPKINENHYYINIKHSKPNSTKNLSEKNFFNRVVTRRNKLLPLKNNKIT